MLNLILIALGSAFGGVFRYLLSVRMLTWLGHEFPYGTLVVNMVGCLLIGLLFALFLERFAEMAGHLRALFIIGFLGGFTTFSSFSFETIQLIENGELLKSFLNVFLSVIICLSLTWLGILLGRQL